MNELATHKADNMFVYVYRYNLMQYTGMEYEQDLCVAVIDAVDKTGIYCYSYSYSYSHSIGVYIYKYIQYVPRL